MILLRLSAICCTVAFVGGCALSDLSQGEALLQQNKPREAAAIFERLAEHGNARALNYLATLYPEKAHAYRLRASRQGLLPADRMLWHEDVLIKKTR